MFLPPDLRVWLVEDDLVHFVIRAVAAAAAFVLRGEQCPAPEDLCREWAGNCAIRRHRWKLVWDALNQKQQWELYGVVADRTELHDLATEKPSLVKELGAAYERWATATGRRIPKARVTGKGPGRAATTDSALPPE